MTARVAVTFAVTNLNTENIWQVIDHFENPETDFGSRKVIEGESRFIKDNSALLVFDMNPSEIYEGIASYSYIVIAIASYI